MNKILGEYEMNILLFMSVGFDTPGPSLHLYKALIEDLLKAGHKVHVIESHSSGINPDCPEALKNLPNFSYETINIEVVEKKAFVKRYIMDLLFIRYIFDEYVIKRENYNGKESWSKAACRSEAPPGA